MRSGPALLLVALACAIQAAAGPLYRVGNVAPDFPLLALTYLTFFAPRRSVLGLGAATAAAIDLISLDPLGTRLLGYLPPLWFAGRARRGFIAESALLRL
ncbi:MAG: rod shape-determining protein MreD, partial [Thermoanaerobaculia bacterium]